MIDVTISTHKERSHKQTRNTQTKGKEGRGTIQRQGKEDGKYGSLSRYRVCKGRKYAKMGIHENTRGNEGT